MSEDLRVFYDGDSSYAARDVADATALWEELNGCKWADEHQDEMPEDLWSERPLDELTVVTFDHANDANRAAPVGAEIVPNKDGYGCKVKATWRQWATKGRGFICAENW